MKHTFSKLLGVFLVLVSLMQCNKKDDFSNRTITGTIKDNNDIPLNGDLNSNNIIVRLLGEGDKSTIDIRVNGEGEYTNNKMFSKTYKAWVEGPIVTSDTIIVDLSAGDKVEDFVVTPLIFAKVINSTVVGTSISVDYSLLENAGNAIDKKEVYCSTVPYPTASIGSRTNVYFTKTVQVVASNGSVLIDDLPPGRYYIRIGAKAKSSVLVNYSNQFEVTIP